MRVRERRRRVQRIADRARRDQTSGRNAAAGRVQEEIDAMPAPAISSNARTIGTLVLMAALLVPLQACGVQGDDDRGSSGRSLLATAM